MQRTFGQRSAGARKPGTGALGTLYRKELADHLNSARFYIIFALLAVTSLVSLMSALGGIEDAVSSSSEFLFLKLYTSSNGSIPSFGSFLAYLAPLAGLALGFDAINRERSQGTLNRLVSQPIHRDSVIIAKFLAGVTVIVIIIFTLGIGVGAVGLAVIGIPPSAEEIARIGAYLLFTAAYTSLWLGLSMLCSVLCRHAATSALIVIAMWIFLTMFATMIAGAVADAVYPTEGIMGFANLMDNYELELALNRISPYYLYCEAVSTLLNPNVRTLGITTQASLSGAIASYLSFDQSLLLIWPHLTCMIALTMAAFTVAYIAFMRQEIRA